MSRFLTAVLLMLCMALPAPLPALTNAAACIDTAKECSAGACACCESHCACAEMPEEPSRSPLVPPAGAELRSAAALPPQSVETPAAPFRLRSEGMQRAWTPEMGAQCPPVPLYVKHRALLL